MGGKLCFVGNAAATTVWDTALVCVIDSDNWTFPTNPQLNDDLPDL